MSTISLVAGAVGIIIAILLLLQQWQQRSKDSQRRDLKALANRAKNLSSLAQSIPPDYIDKKILLLLLQTAKERWHQLNQVDGKHSYQSQIEDLDLLVDNVKAGQVIAAPLDPGNEIHGREFRKNLKSLFKFIEVQGKTGKLDQTMANQQLLRTQFFLCQSLANAHIVKADQAEKLQKYRVAIHHLYDATEALKKVANNPLAQEAMADFQQRMTLLEAKARKQTQANSGIVTTPQNTSLSEQLNELDKKEMEWIRKQEYE